MIDMYVSRTETRDKITAITIASSKKDTLGSVETNRIPGTYKLIKLSVYIFM